jgi:hypothetical protein
LSDQVFSLLATGLWCIPLIALAGLLGVALLMRAWRFHTMQDMKDIHTELRSYEAQTRQATATLQGISPADPEPYGTLAARLHNQLQELQRQVHNLRLGYVTIQEQVHRLSAARWNAFFRAPYEWYHLRGDIAAMKRELEKPRVLMESMSLGQQTLDRLAWQTALILQQARDLHLKASRSLERLQAKHVRGEALETAVRQVEQARQAMAALPAYFFTGSEEDIVSQADRAAVVAAYEINLTHGPLLAQTATQVQEWETAYSHAVEHAAALRASLAALEQGVASASPVLVLDEFTRQIQGTAVISQALQATLSRLEVESLSEVDEQTATTQRLVDEMEKNLQQARQDQAALESLLPELQDNLKAVSAQFSNLGTSSIHPLVWDTSSPRLTRLSQQVSALGSLRKPRSPQQVGQDLKSTRQLNIECLELAQYCQQVAQQHAQLLDLLASPEIGQGLGWFAEAEKLLTQVQTYNPENWPAADRVQDLPAELDSLKDGLESLTGAAHNRPITENQLALSLEDVRFLKENQQALRQRVSNVQARLVEIRLVEGHAGEQLGRAQVTLNLMESLGRSNRYLQPMAARETPRLQFSVQALQDELDHGERSTVDKKSRQVKALIQQLEDQANQWLDRLRQDTRGKAAALAASISTLDQVARLDEPALAEARRLVSAAPSYELHGRGQKSALGLDQLGLELRRQCEYWEKCDAAQKALAEVEKPALEISRQVSRNRQDVQKQMETAQALLRRQDAWLPVNLTLDPERRELEALEKQWQAAQEEQATAIQLVARLGGLSSRYQVLSEKIERATERVTREQADVDAQVQEMEEQQQLWHQLQREHRESPQANQEIRELLDGVEQEARRLKEQSRRGDLTAEQLQQALKKVNRRLRLAQVAIDDQHAVDINGRVITSKDSTYREI